MVFEHIEKLKREYTDKYVAIANMVPELKRFEGRTGIVRTVNMSGRALVEFLGSNDISWYDIDVDFLKIVQPPEQTRDQASAKQEAPGKPTTAEAGSSKKPATSTADILAMARGKAKAKPAEEKPANKKPSTADILAAARGKGAPGKGSASPEQTPEGKGKDTQSLSTAETLALLRGKSKPPANASPETEPPAEQDKPPQKPSTADILAMARGKKPPSNQADQKESSPKKPSTADILAMARGQKKKPEANQSDDPQSEKPSQE
ncbi:hypothetical protein [Blastopirellula marina]|nr:hypothetical protein [Blastopirellula marina]